MEQQAIANGGMQYVLPIAEPQIMYLDFDGENTCYNGDFLKIDHVEVLPSRLTAERIGYIVEELNRRYAARNILFVTERPADKACSTIFVGSTEAFAPYGHFAGLAESVDTGNQNKSDNAFVMLGSSASDEKIIDTISHEADHLTGTLDHGGEGLERYGAHHYYNCFFSGTLGSTIGLDVNSVAYSSYGAGSSAVYHYSLAEDVTLVSGGGFNGSGFSLKHVGTENAHIDFINHRGEVRNVSGLRTYGTNSFTVTGTASDVVLSGFAVASNRTSYRASMTVVNGGVAKGTYVNRFGFLCASSGGVLSDTQINGGSMFLGTDGQAVNTVMTSGNIVANAGVQLSGTTVSSGTLVLSSGAGADDTLINSGGAMYLSSGAAANGITMTYDGFISGYKLQLDHYGSTAASIGMVRSDGIVEYVSGVCTGMSNSVCVAVSAGAMTVSTEATHPDQHAEMTLLSGAAASGCSAGANGLIFVEHGAAAFDTSIDRDGELHISGTAVRTTLCHYSGKVHVHSGGVASETVVSGGSLILSAGASAENTTVHAGGTLLLSVGATANDVVLTSSGIVSGNNLKLAHYGSAAASIGAIRSDGAVEYVSGVCTGMSNSVCVAVSAGAMTVSTEATHPDQHAEMTFLSGAAASGCSAGANGLIFVEHGAAAFDTSIDRDGELHISGTAVRTTLCHYSGKVHVHSGGVASETVVSGGSLILSAGASAENTAIHSGGAMYLSSGATANGITMTSRGVVSGNNLKLAHYGSTAASIGMIRSDGIVEYVSGVYTGQGNSVYVAGSAVDMTVITTDSYQLNHAKVTLLSGAAASGCTVGSNGHIYIRSGAAAFGNTVEQRGEFRVNGGIAVQTLVKGGSAVVSVGGFVSETVVSGGSLTVSSGGTASGTFLSGGVMTVSSGGIASGTFLSGGVLAVSFGGTVDGTTVFAGGSMSIGSRASAGNVILYSGGSVGGRVSFWHNGSGSAVIGRIIHDVIANVSGLNVAPGGKIRVSGSADGVTIGGSSGTLTSMTLIAGGRAFETTVNSYGRLYVSSGAVVENTCAFDGMTYIYSGAAASNTVMSSGALYISSGGVHGGTLQITSGATVSFSSGSILEFDLTERSAEADCLINDLSLISGTPRYTVTVSATQETGVYQLAEGAAKFNKTVTVSDGTTDFGVLTVNGPAVTFDSRSYALGLQEGVLSLSVTYDGFEVTSGEGSVSWQKRDGSEADRCFIRYGQQETTPEMEFATDENTLDIYGGPGSYKLDISADGVNWQENTFAGSQDESVQQFVSNGNDVFDLFLVKAKGTWDEGYAAQHLGSIGNWRGTREKVLLAGKNILADIFEGSADSNVLMMTDDANGDALFVDDIYTALPGTLNEQQARIAAIDEICAGAGDDIVDMTSQRFAYTGDGIRIHGGSGNDVIWANAGSHILLGDDGDDRIVGGSGNDLISGGTGNDQLHGGGGADIFCFSGMFGDDTVEQLPEGSVELRIEGGSEMFWNSETLTYSDGNSRIRVKGVAADRVALVFDCGLAGS